MKRYCSSPNARTFRKAKMTLLSQARKKHGRIIPCGDLKSSFTKEDDTLYFWYLTEHDRSTHLTSCKLP
jgi:hypothetical protein